MSQNSCRLSTQVIILNTVSVSQYRWRRSMPTMCSVTLSSLPISQGEYIQSSELLPLYCTILLHLTPCRGELMVVTYLFMRGENMGQLLIPSSVSCPCLRGKHCPVRTLVAYLLCLQKPSYITRPRVHLETWFWLHKMQILFYRTYPKMEYF